ncbi:MAG: cation-translocating P-type ATPase [Anaerolineae bacterium]|nr:MAG: cation-translocating P-type ATPase [Anaerolineae bacterium]
MNQVIEKYSIDLHSNSKSHTSPQNSEWYQHEIEGALQELKSDFNHGLSEEEASLRLQQYGPNELQDFGRKNPLLILWAQFTSTMVLILIAAAVLSGFLGKPLETIAISVIVILFAVLGFIQEYRAERAMAALKKLSIPLVNVRRDGQFTQIPSTQLVPGDIVMLEAGNIIPADMRLIESNNLRVQEAALTGESEPVEKHTRALDNANIPLGDRLNMAYLGTLVTYGRGIGVVTTSGMQTELGKIATLIQSVESEMTPLQKQLDHVGKVLAGLGVLVAVLIMVIGLLSGESIRDMFLTAVSVAVAVVPEGLPAVVTLTLALGAQRMLNRKALIRKLPAVETLGSVTVICSDKTGTLTQNRMTVTVIDVAGHHLELVGTGKDQVPDSVRFESAISLADQPPAVKLLLTCSALCNDASLKPDPETGRYDAVGDPTEGALLVAASQAGLLKDELEKIMPRVSELPFDSDRKRMTTVHRLPEDSGLLPELLQPVRLLDTPYLAITKGSPDGLLDVADRVWSNGHIETLDASWVTRIQQASEQLAENGMRVLGVAIEPVSEIPSQSALEKHVVFVGLLGMIDPPRPEVKAAVQTCKTAGIRPIMITGDHPLTARFIAHDLGISGNGRVKTGQMLDEMSDDDLKSIVEEVSIYARVTPEHKLRIVHALQGNGHVVAMTGDGVNDSPALKKANIGVAMGITGTDVSKEAAQMVLLDDNFATIVSAVEEGRVIYDNIRRFVTFSIAGNLGKVIVMLFAPLLGIVVALLPLQLLWLNLLTDGLLGLGLGMEPAEKNTMTQPPRSPKARILSGAVNSYIALVGILIGIIALSIGYIYHDPDDLADKTWQTMIFTSIAFMQVGQALASRSAHPSLFSLGFRTNPLMLWMVVLAIGLQLAAIYLPFLEDFFQVNPLSLVELIVCIVCGIIVFTTIKLRNLLAAKPQLAS